VILSHLRTSGNSALMELLKQFRASGAFVPPKPDAMRLEKKS